MNDISKALSFFRAWAVLAIVLVSCGDEPRTRNKANPLEWSKKNRLIISTTNYQSGQLEMVQLDTGEMRTPVRIHSNSIVRSSKLNEITVVNGFGADNLQIVKLPQFVSEPETSFGRGTSLQDVATTESGSRFVSSFSGTSLLRIDSNGQTASISVESFSDKDGKPEMGFMKVVGSTLLVQMMRLDITKGFTPAGKSLIAKLDLKSERFVDSALTLAHANPVTDFKMGHDNQLYVGCAGYMGFQSKLDGGIQQIKTDDLSLGSVLVTESELGGDIVDFEVISPSTLVVSVATNGKTQLLLWNYLEHRLVAKLTEGKGFTLQNMIWDRDRNLLFIADRNETQFGVAAWDTITWKEKARYPTQLPPYFLILADEK